MPENPFSYRHICDVKRLKRRPVNLKLVAGLLHDAGTTPDYQTPGCGTVSRNPLPHLGTGTNSQYAVIFILGVFGSNLRLSQPSRKNAGGETSGTS